MEIVVVIGIIAILMAVAIPNYIAWLPKYRVGTAIRQLYTEMQSAKQKAITDNNDYMVTFDTVNNLYSILDDDNNNGAADVGELVKTIVVNQEAPGIIFSTDAGDLTFTGAPPTVTLRPTGLANKNGTATVRPSNNATLKKKITVLMTGRIKIFYQ